MGIDYKLMYPAYQQNNNLMLNGSNSYDFAANSALMQYPSAYPVTNPLTIQPTTAPSTDTVELSAKKDYSADDGKISFGDKLKNFGKGLISPVTNMFKSPKNFLIGAGMIIAGAALVVATGGAAAPVLVAAGVAGGAIQFGTSAVKAANAKTDAEAEQAWQGMGAGTSSVALSVAGAKTSLKAAGCVDDVSNMSALQATAQCFKAAPSQAVKSTQMFTSGQALTNLKAAVPQNIFKPKTETKPIVDADAAPVNNAKTPVVDADSVPVSDNKVPVVDADSAPAVETSTVIASADDVKAPQAGSTASSIDDAANLADDVKPVNETTQNSKVNDVDSVNNTDAPEAVVSAKDPTIFRETKTTIVDKATGQTKEATLVYKKQEFTEKIELYIDGECRGYTTIKNIKPGDEVYQFSPAADYMKDGAVYVDLMESSYSGAGTKLHQAAVLRSQELGYGGRVALDAAWNSHSFHYSSGFRPTGKNALQNAEAIANAIAAAKGTGVRANTTDLGGVIMTLPEENIAMILAK